MQFLFSSTNQISIILIYVYHLKAIWKTRPICKFSLHLHAFVFPMSFQRYGTSAKRYDLKKKKMIQSASRGKRKVTDYCYINPCWLAVLTVVKIFQKLLEKQMWWVLSEEKKKKEFFGLSITYEFYELFKERLYTLKLICLPSSATPNCLHPGQAGSGTILGRLHGLTCLNLLLA